VPGGNAALSRSLPNRLAERFTKVTAKLPQSTESERLMQRIGLELFREALMGGAAARRRAWNAAPLLQPPHARPRAACE
jgi:hypothetical protein